MTNISEVLVHVVTYNAYKLGHHLNISCAITCEKSRFLWMIQHNMRESFTGAGRGISIGREGPVAPVPEPVLQFRD